ncbi:hypothetical protein DM01DRAFT_1373689 [Hesseltinella vesiculosa]|uniref:Uncharacterized protein n=1 Tax=Hesseltinella vesiculosa TaxID=101127 RepID=A0A1X2GJ84_9FUNG|nr:hypothetical protein DM01DRAFT_1373689 [Hesseltinella vesiculosa]
MPAYDDRAAASATASASRASPGRSASPPPPSFASPSTFFSAPYSGYVPAEENYQKTHSGCVPADEENQKTQKNSPNSGYVPADENQENTQKNYENAVEKAKKNTYAPYATSSVSSAPVSVSSAPAPITRPGYAHLPPSPLSPVGSPLLGPVSEALSAAFRPLPSATQPAARFRALAPSSLPGDSLLRNLLVRRLKLRAANKRRSDGDDSARFANRRGPKHACKFVVLSRPVAPASPAPARVGNKRRGVWDDNTRFSGRRGPKSVSSGASGPSTMVGAIWPNQFLGLGPTLPYLPGVVLFPGPCLLARGPAYVRSGHFGTYWPPIKFVGQKGAITCAQTNKNGIWGKLVRRHAPVVGASKPQMKGKAPSSCFRPLNIKTTAQTFAKGAVNLLAGFSVAGWRSNRALASNALYWGIFYLLSGADVDWCSPRRPHESYTVLGKRSREATVRKELPERKFKRARAVHPASCFGCLVSGVGAGRVPGTPVGCVSSAAGGPFASGAPVDLFAGALGAAAPAAPATSLRGRRNGGRRVEGHRRRWANHMPNLVVTFGPMVSVPGGRTVLLGFPPYHIVPGRFVSIAPGVVWYLRPRHNNAVASNTATGAAVVGADHAISVGAGHVGWLRGAAGAAAPAQGLSRCRAGGRRGRRAKPLPNFTANLGPMFGAPGGPT